MAMSADLGKALEDFVENLVKTGRYRSRSEVLREGIRLVQEREAKLAALEALVQEGVRDADAGRTIPAEEVFAEIRAELEAMKGKRRAGKVFARRAPGSLRDRAISCWLQYRRSSDDGHSHRRRLHRACQLSRLFRVIFPSVPRLICGGDRWGTI